MNDSNETLQRAELLDRQIRALDIQYKLNFAQRAVALLEMEQDSLWAYLYRPDGHPYRSFSQWLEDAAKFSERDCRYALAAIKELRDIPESDFKQMPRESIEIMKLVPESLREDYIEPAKTMKPEQFFSKIDTDHPELHLERRKSVHIKPDESQGSKIQDALKMAQLHGATSKTQAWEMVAEAALTYWEQMEMLEDAQFHVEAGLVRPN